MGRAMRARQAAQARKKRIQTAVVVTAVVAVATAVVIIMAVSGNSAGTAAGSGAVDATNASVGKPFPDFALTAIDGSQVSKSSLAGKPSLVWFTTVNCLPAQTGAARVSELNEELGNRFRVLVVFASEPASSLVSWRDRYAGKDWTIARDAQTDLIRKVNLRYVDDTKFVLNDRGEIIDVDSTPVGDGFLELMRKQVTA